MTDEIKKAQDKAEELGRLIAGTAFFAVPADNVRETTSNQYFLIPVTSPPDPVIWSGAEQVHAHRS